MNPIGKAAAAGAVGALTTNVLHEAVRRVVPDAPRIDLLGMQAMSRLFGGADAEPPVGKHLYRTTLAGDLASNSAYFALVGLAPRGTSASIGFGLGVIGGLGAAYLPAPLGLSTEPTSRTGLTRALTVALYAAGGLAAGLALTAMSTNGADETGTNGELERYGTSNASSSASNGSASNGSGSGSSSATSGSAASQARWNAAASENASAGTTSDREIEGGSTAPGTGGAMGSGGATGATEGAGDSY